MFRHIVSGINTSGRKITPTLESVWNIMTNDWFILPTRALKVTKWSNVGWKTNTEIDTIAIALLACTHPRKLFVIHNNPNSM